MSNIRTLEQGRAQFAYKCAEEGKSLGKDYKQYVKKIPMMIKTNGLGSAFAYIFSKSEWKKENGQEKPKNAYAQIYEHTYRWLKQNNKLGIFKPNENEDLVAKVINLESQQYRALTNEVLAFFNWLRRFADGLIED